MGLRTDDLTIPQGTTWRVQWPVLDDAGNPADLAGYTVDAQVRKTRGDATILHEWSTADGTATVDGSTVTLSVDPAVSSAWEWTAGMYDVKLTSADGSVTRLTQGNVRVDAEVTR